MSAHQETTYTAPAPFSTVRELIDAYMADYHGRDGSVGTRLKLWKELIGDVPLAEITDDHVFHSLDRIAREPARVYHGKDADGRPVYRAKGQRSSGTINRYHASLGGAFSWAIRRRRVCRGFESPTRRVPKHAERPGVVRFLCEQERVRLLDACRASPWPRLYVLVLMAITTGARRGELEGLRWQDVDLDRREAQVPTTKNGHPKVLPLVAGVVDELRRFRAEDAAHYKIGLPSRRLFGSRLRPDLPLNFTEHWKDALKKGRITNFRFHDLRHTCASYLAQQGASLLQIADVMGHRQLAMVKRYAHLTTGTKKALIDQMMGDIR
jgi:integrase